MSKVRPWWGENFEEVSEFTYHDNNTDTTGAADMGVTARIGKARCALQQVWSCSGVPRPSPITLKCAAIKRVLLYGSETWRLLTVSMKRFNCSTTEFWGILTRQILLAPRTIVGESTSVQLRCNCYIEDGNGYDTFCTKRVKSVQVRRINKMS